MRRLCLRLRAVRLLSRMQRSEQGSVVALALVVAVGVSASLLLLQPMQTREKSE